MGIFDKMAQHRHEQVAFCYDKVSGLKSIIAIHNTGLGPALGGTRMWPYDSEELALDDALRLSLGMTYKSGAAGCNFGGGKAVIWGDPGKDKNEMAFRALGMFIQSFDGRFITGTDVGTVADDFVWARAVTPYLVALPEEHGGSGDSSLTTAFGVWHGLRACAEEVFGAPSLKGLRVAVQGVGKVGYRLCGYLLEEGAEVTVTDVSRANLERTRSKYEVKEVEPEDIYSVDCDIFSPNALGAVLNDDTIPRLKAKIVAGAANNQLAEPRHGDELHRRGIVYAPDYVINAGGLIQVAEEFPTFSRDRAMKRASGIYESLKRIFEISRRDNIPTYHAANLMVEERLARAAAGRIYLRTAGGTTSQLRRARPGCDLPVR
jgi:leucine dehydrogenase